MYALPTFTLYFDPLSAVVAVMLFTVGVVGATVLTCRGEMRESPASLMFIAAFNREGTFPFEIKAPEASRVGDRDAC